MSDITISAFKWVPPFAQGLVRDLRVRWALEEAGLPYRTHLLGLGDNTAENYLRWQPFGQVPAYREGNGQELFESGAIVYHVAQQSEALLPRDAAGQARTVTWMFAALNTVEPYVAELATLDLFHPEEAWAKARRPGAVELLLAKLKSLSDRLAGRQYLEDRFTVADLLMVTVLRGLRHTDILQGFPVLEAYRLRGEARPAFQKALADQMAVFEENAPVAA
jgi:glutathione S-transferase